MPEPEVIRRNLLILPQIEVSKIPDKSDSWIDQELGANFIVTKRFLGNNPRLNLCVLSVNGTIMGKEKVVGDFLDFLGLPINIDGRFIDPGPIHVSWRMAKVDQILQGEVLT